MTGYLWTIIVDSGIYNISDLRLDSLITANIRVCSYVNNCLIGFGGNTSLKLTNTNLTFSGVCLNFWDTHCMATAILLKDDSCVIIEGCAINCAINGFTPRLTAVVGSTSTSGGFLGLTLINCVFNVYLNGVCATNTIPSIIDFSFCFSSFYFCMNNVRLNIEDNYNGLSSFVFAKLGVCKKSYFTVMDSLIQWKIIGSGTEKRTFIKTGALSDASHIQNQVRNNQINFLSSHSALCVCSYDSIGNSGHVLSNNNCFANIGTGSYVCFDIGLGDVVSAIGNTSTGTITNNTGSGSYEGGIEHTHANGTLLDTYDQTNADISTAVLWKHFHYVFHDKDVQNVYAYYGFSFLNYWKITRKTLASKIWANATGTGTYATAWADRESKTYV
jgi:hypothetical protein